MSTGREKELDAQIEAAVLAAFQKHFSKSVVVDVPPELAKEVRAEMAQQSLTAVPRNQLEIIEDMLRMLKTSHAREEEMMLEERIATCRTNIASHESFVEESRKRLAALTKQLWVLRNGPADGYPSDEVKP